MDYEKAYHETIEQLYLVTSRLSRHEQQNELLAVLWEYKAFLDEFATQVEQLPTERKTKAKNHIMQLYKYYNMYADFYMEGIVYRLKSAKLEKQLHDLALRCKELEEENLKLNEMNNF